MRVSMCMWVFMCGSVYERVCERFYACQYVYVSLCVEVLYAQIWKAEKTVREIGRGTSIIMF